MSPILKNILIFVAGGAILFFVYTYFSNKAPLEGELVSSNPAFAGDSTGQITQEFLSLLLSVRGIKLDDSIFSDKAFGSLRDSSVVLIPDGNEGRPNPFAPIGIDIAPVVPPPATTPATTTPPATTTSPATTPTLPQGTPGSASSTTTTLTTPKPTTPASTSTPPSPPGSSTVPDATPEELSALGDELDALAGGLDE
ncbi:MAG TPA: hypothetical protein VFQ59_02225 [Candidatus Paceibacterota bacterium]|nr:hypothetical protein [Candidatus Paceibacterota bacterium]